MPGTRCAVATCNNSLLQTKKDNLQVTYHKFPKNEQMCKAWVSACRRKDKWNPQTSTICSAHFKEDDYEKDLKAELLNIPTRRRLKPTAFPTLLLVLNDNRQRLKSLVNARKKQLSRKRPKTVAQKSANFLECSVNPVEDLRLPENPKNDSVEMVEYTKEKYDKLLQEHGELKEKYKSLQDEFEDQKRQLENTEKLLTNLTTKYQSKTQDKEDITLREVCAMQHRRDEMKTIKAKCRLSCITSTTSRAT